MKIDNPYGIECSPNTQYRIGTKILIDFARNHGLDLVPRKREGLKFPITTNMGLKIVNDENP